VKIRNNALFSFSPFLLYLIGAGRRGEIDICRAVVSEAGALPFSPPPPSQGRRILESRLPFRHPGCAPGWAKKAKSGALFLFFFTSLFPAHQPQKKFVVSKRLSLFPLSSLPSPPAGSLSRTAVSSWEAGAEAYSVPQVIEGEDEKRKKRKYLFW